MAVGTWVKVKMVFEIEQSGNVGVGTTTPGTILTTHGTTGVRANLTSNSSGVNFFEGTYNGTQQFKAGFGGAGDIQFVITDTIDNSNGNYFIQKSGESFGRAVFGRGFIAFGPGSATRDTYLTRSTTNTFLISSDQSTGAANLNITGSLGVGTTTPLAKLGVVGTAGNNIIADFASSTGATALRINPANLVSIGTTLTRDRLYIAGIAGPTGNTPSLPGNVVYINNASDAFIQLMTPNTQNSGIRFGDPQAEGAGYTAYNHPGNYMEWGVNGAASVMRLISTGHLGVGTTTPIGRISAVGVAGNNDIADFASSTGVSVLRVTPQSHVGIATSTPQQTLVVNGSTTVTNLTAANCDVLADTIGGLYCGTNGAGGTPGGDNTEFQFNSTGSFGGADNLVYVSGNVGVATATPSSAFSIGAATTTMHGVLRIKNNQLSQHAAGFLDFQRSGTDYTLLRIRAPRGSSNEATLSLVLDKSATDTGVDEEFLDFYNEQYSDSHQAGLRLVNTGTGARKPFVISYWDGVILKDAGNAFTVMPSLTVAIGAVASSTAITATSTIDQTAALHVMAATTTITKLLRMDATPGGPNRFMFLPNGNFGIGSSTPTLPLSFGGTGQVIAYPDNTTQGSNGVLVVADQKTSGTAGGTSAAGMQTRTLNTVISSTTPGTSLSSNQVTLPAGTYCVEASAPAFIADKHRIFWYNVTDSATTTVGQSAYNDAATNAVETSALLDGCFTIASSKAFELRHYIQTSRATNGLGVFIAGGPEIYAQVRIEKK